MSQMKYDHVREAKNIFISYAKRRILHVIT